MKSWRTGKTSVIATAIFLRIVVTSYNYEKGLSKKQCIQPDSLEFFLLKLILTIYSELFTNFSLNKI